MVRRMVPGWLVVAVLLGTMVYTVAEEFKLMTYLPSPRAAYKELWAGGNFLIGSITFSAVSPRLHVIQEDSLTTQPPFQMEDRDDGTFFLIDAEGRVGIGTIDPEVPLTAPLTLEGDDATTTLLINNTAATGDPQVGFRLGGDTNVFTLGIDDSDSDTFKISTSALGTSDRLVIDSLGHVGIGVPANTDLTHTLEVNGTIKATSFIHVGSHNLPAICTRGQEFFVHGDGVADQLYLCVQTETAGLYEWVPL